MKAPLLASALLLAACASTGHESSSAKVVQPASESDRAALIDRIKTLEGTWESNGPNGTVVAAVFSVGSGGSTVREIMMPGSEYEMTNMYTMDGPTLLMTHYCAMGNQPHMRATAGKDMNTVRFVSDGVSNLRKADELYMGSMTLTIVNKDHIRTDWTSYQNGQAQAPSSFTLTRKK